MRCPVCEVRKGPCVDAAGAPIAQWIVQHADWCGRGERPASERDRREVRGAARGKAAA